MSGLRVGAFALLLLLPAAATAQENDQSLAEQLANPISSLISVPLGAVATFLFPTGGQRVLQGGLP